MSDRPLPLVSDPEEARNALLRHRASALDGYDWEELGPLAILVPLLGQRTSGEVDEYMAKFSFLYYPAWPPCVTFVNPETKRYDPAYWPKGGGPNLAFLSQYGDAPEGMVCNSMFFEYYFWGGHQPNDAIRWNPARHTFAASLNELRFHLQPPYYQGASR